MISRILRRRKAKLKIGINNKARERPRRNAESSFKKAQRQIMRKNKKQVKQIKYRLKHLHKLSLPKQRAQRGEAVKMNLIQKAILKEKIKQIPLYA